MDKKQVIKHLETISTYLELKGENAFKISAYRKAAQALERDDRSLGEIDDVGALNGIGKGTKAIIEEFIANGETETLKTLAEEVPQGLIPLLKIQGLGGKKLARLYQEIGVIDEATLRKACENGEVEALSGFGKKSVEKIVKALDDANTRPERLPVSYVIPIKEEIEAHLRPISDILDFSVAGSLRRLNETVKDIDFIVATTKPEVVADQLVQLSMVKEVVSKGMTKVTVIVEGEWDISVDFRLIDPEHFVTTLHHFTGSKDHNVEMRRLAKDKGLKISEYGIEHSETGENHTFQSEEQFFNFLDLPYLPPEVRESGEEVSLNELPELVNLNHIRGDLHMHTTWSDGAQSIDEMIEKALEKGYEFIAITDHSKFLRVANGLNEKRLREQRQKIQEWNEKYPDITVLSGVEMDILPNGDLDFDDDFLKEMDFVIASIHSSFNQSEEQIMKRLKNALECPYVDMIAHPTGRLIGKRSGYPVNYEQFIELAVQNDTIIELNANPNRLDLAWKWLQVAQEQGAKIAINTDAHNYNMLDDMKIGVQAARKGFIEKDTIVNTWGIEDLLRFLKQKKGD
ncbi:DNA polymerase/3'-5' exonuclease PolX [Tenuibacillus multivorans]|uniref:DNA-directed DNA polymerase n=1 Tax=Tenuibacillus multivorans TaxID=237069 RepID=A0A1G9ZR34_9BACI|nr:DNA polymerase/3'-5' exonuclease PolX [Tenuibacillus multivorans]GEL76813.1 DNA polymerase/3'-5' exonuclease PolX [Tenuibacillus multivorans]SDN23557.1 DNA polymerase (family 10) [Tenuibacillus multivorans]